MQQAIHTGAQVLVSPDGVAAWKASQPRQMAKKPLAKRMRAELATEAGRALYGRRQAIVEQVIGYIKDVGGFRRFALRRLSHYSGNSHYTSRGRVTHKRVASAASAQQGDQNNQFLHHCPL